MDRVCVKVSLDSTNCVTRSPARRGRWILEHFSVLNSTASLSVVSTTDGNHTHMSAVRTHTHSGFYKNILVSFFISIFSSDQEVCKLYCFAEGYDFFFALSSKVHDGTLCMKNRSNVCIQGVCEVNMDNITHH